MNNNKALSSEGEGDGKKEANDEKWLNGYLIMNVIYVIEAFVCDMKPKIVKENIRKKTKGVERTMPTIKIYPRNRGNAEPSLEFTGSVEILNGGIIRIAVNKNLAKRFKELEGWLG